MDWLVCWTGCAAGGAVAIGTWASGSVAAIPAAVALGVVARSDVTTRRFSLRLVAWASVAVVACLAGEALSSGGGLRLVRAVLTVAALFAVSSVLWSTLPGVAFGDVLLVSFAALVPAWISPLAVLGMLCVSFVAAGVMVLVRRIQHGIDGASRTVAFGPFLLVGWTAGLVVS